MIALDVSQNTALSSLRCSDNPLTSLDVSYNTALTVLQCNNTQITNLDISQNISLILLHCRNNNLHSLDLRNGNNHNFNGNQWQMNAMAASLAPHIRT